MAFISVQLIKKLLGNHRRPQIAKETLKKNKVGSIMLPDFKQYYKATIIKMFWYWHQNRYINQWTRIESPEILACNSQLIYDWDIHWGEDSLFSKCCWGNLDGYMQKWNGTIFLTPYTKISSKWIKELNVGPETMKLLEENISSELSELLLAVYFWMWFLGKEKQK